VKADLFISRLQKVRATSQQSWVACCPAHEDKNPSMAIREVDDGRVLVHCFAGCSVEEILGAVGLTFDALFPEKLVENAKPLRRPFAAADVLESLANEAMIVAVASSNIRQGVQLSDEDHERLWTATNRITAAKEMALG
jgi:hypothetical protein